MTDPTVLASKKAIITLKEDRPDLWEQLQSLSKVNSQSLTDSMLQFYRAEFSCLKQDSLKLLDSDVRNAARATFLIKRSDNYSKQIMTCAEELRSSHAFLWQCLLSREASRSAAIEPLAEDEFDKYLSSQEHKIEDFQVTQLMFDIRVLASVTALNTLSDVGL